MTELGSYIRSGTLEHLKLLSSAQLQLDYERAVPIAQVPEELFCIWFDDLGYCSHQISSVGGSFSDSELEHLQKFHNEFEKAFDEVEPVPSSVTELHRLDAWQTLMSQADLCLKNLNAAEQDAAANP